MQPSYKTLSEAFQIKDCCPICKIVLQADFSTPFNNVKVYRCNDVITCSERDLSLNLSINFDLNQNNFSIDEDSYIDRSITDIGSTINTWLITPEVYCTNCSYMLQFQSLRFDLSLNKIYKIVPAMERLKIGNYSIINGFPENNHSYCHVYKLVDDYPLIGKTSENYDFTNKTLSEIESWIKTVTIFS